jgi:hypothetical protein
MVLTNILLANAEVSDNCKAEKLDDAGKPTDYYTNNINEGSGGRLTGDPFVYRVVESTLYDAGQSPKAQRMMSAMHRFAPSADVLSKGHIPLAGPKLVVARARQLGRQ